MAEQRAEAAEERAKQAEQLADAHQDYFARRYDEQLEALERREAAFRKERAGVAAEKYLRIYQRAAELAQRLSEYETVEPLLPLLAPEPPSG